MSEPARSAGVPILFHSDGKIDDAVEMLLAMGADCLNPMDPSGVDYRNYNRRYGDRVTLSGNIDILTLIDGGDGNDHMKAGRGPSVLMGGAGNDRLIGGFGKSVLIVTDVDLAQTRHH